MKCDRPVCKARGCMVPQDCPEDRKASPTSSCSVSDEMLEAAMRVAVDRGVFPSIALSVQGYSQTAPVLAEIIEAALLAQNVPSAGTGEAR